VRYQADRRTLISRSTSDSRIRGVANISFELSRICCRDARVEVGWGAFAMCLPFANRHGDPELKLRHRDPVVLDDRFVEIGEAADDSGRSACRHRAKCTDDELRTSARCHMFLEMRD
jgi:hypothetical protein